MRTLDMGIVWAEVRRWILVMRKAQIISKEMAKREWVICHRYLGEGRLRRHLKHWMLLTTYDELREIGESHLRGEK